MPDIQRGDPGNQQPETKPTVNTADDQLRRILEMDAIQQDFADMRALDADLKGERGFDYARGER